MAHPYSDVEKVREILRGSTQDEDGGSAAELDDPQIELDINNADEQIDALLMKKYVVPFEPVPSLIASLSRDIAAYLSDLNYRKSREYESDNYPIIRRYSKATEMLEWLRTGVASLDAPRATSDSDDSDSVYHRYSPALFNVTDSFGDGMRDW